MLRSPKKSLLKRPSDQSVAAKIRRRVSFADFNGQALEQIRIFDDRHDEADDTFLWRKAQANPQMSGGFVPYFTLPWNSPGNEKSVYSALVGRQICLETVSLSSPSRITGTILVKHFSSKKRVFVRHSLDQWQSQKDMDAEFLCGVNPLVDRFRFDLRFACKVAPGTRLELALGYDLPEIQAQYWDNNYGDNYGFWYNDKM